LRTSQLELNGGPATAGLRPAAEPRPLAVLHLIILQKPPYYINNPLNYSSPGAARFMLVTFTGENEFTADLGRRGIAAGWQDCFGRRNYPQAGRRLRRIIIDHGIEDIVHTHLLWPTLLGVTTAKLLRRPVVITRHHSATVSLIPYLQDHRRFEISEDRVSRVREELGMRRRIDPVRVSRLRPEKEHKYLSEALAALKRQGIETSLYLVRVRALRHSLQRLADTIDSEDWVCSPRPHDDVLAIVAADMAVHPSLKLCHRPSSRLLPRKKPIMATDVSGIRDIVDEYGMIVAPCRCAGLSGGIGADHRQP
jgi:glycosyltransferase involved in cell wall biosynthesis